MSAYELIQIAVVGGVVAWSGWSVVGRYFPLARLKLVDTLRGRKAPAAAITASGCDEGCGSCSGCGTPKAKSQEQPLNFQPRR